MKTNCISIVLLCLGLSISGVAQNGDVDLTNKLIDGKELESHIWFLASDELKGRDTGTPEIDVAASYIASVYRRYGVQMIDSSYYQSFNLETTIPATTGSFEIGDKSYAVGENLIYLRSATWSMDAPAVFAGYGMPDELKSKDIDGAVVVVRTGTAEQTNVRSFASLSQQKIAAAREGGAVALVEIYQSASFPWERIAPFLTQPRLKLPAKVDQGENDPFVHVWINDFDNTLLPYLEGNKMATSRMSFVESVTNKVPSRNVVGIIPGTDPDLKNEYVLLSAHYDHVGVRDGSLGEDSIYNGARDNAIGVSAILGAVSSLSASPAKRSILLLACTAEEKGLLGSRWFAENPPVPLNQIIYNLNIDGGGYNDVTKATVIGLSRTTAQAALVQSCADMGLEAIDDPAPEQGLFDRSDNVQFATKGIPAPTFSTGFTAFDAEIMKYYHQVTDEASTMDFEYLTKYFKAYALAVRRIANMDEPPFWVEGDKYEKAGKELYGKE